MSTKCSFFKEAFNMQYKFEYLVQYVSTGKWFKER